MLWDNGSGRITVIRSKTDAEAQGAVVVITPAAMQALAAIRPAGLDGGMRVFGLSESQIARRVKAIARVVGLENWEIFSGRVGMARRMAQNGAPTHEIERQGAGSRAAAWSAATPAGVNAGPSSLSWSHAASHGNGRQAPPRWYSFTPPSLLIVVVLRSVSS